MLPTLFSCLHTVTCMSCTPTHSSIYSFPASQSIHPSVHLSTCPFPHPSIYPSVHHPAIPHLPAYLLTCPSIHSSICPAIYPSLNPTGILCFLYMLGSDLDTVMSQLRERETISELCSACLQSKHLGGRGRRTRN